MLSSCTDVIHKEQFYRNPVILTSRKERNTHRREEKWTQNFGQKTWREGTNRRT